MKELLNLMNKYGYVWSPTRGKVQLSYEDQPAYHIVSERDPHSMLTFLTIEAACAYLREAHHNA